MGRSRYFCCRTGHIAPSVAFLLHRPSLSISAGCNIKRCDGVNTPSRGALWDQSIWFDVLLDGIILLMMCKFFLVRLTDIWSGKLLLIVRR